MQIRTHHDALDAGPRKDRCGNKRLGAVTRTVNPVGKYKVVALLRAADAGADGALKLAAALRKPPPREQSAAVVTIFNSAQFGLALGRPNVVHAALLAGPAGEAFLARIERIERFSTGKLCESDRRGDQN